MPLSLISEILPMIRHHRVSLWDAVLLIGTIMVAGFIAFEYDFSGTMPEDKRIEFQEAIALGAVIILGIFYFGWRRMIEQEREIMRRVAAEQRAHELAHTDALTGLSNRRQFEKALKEAAASPPGAENVHAVLTLDLNGFKS